MVFPTRTEVLKAISPKVRAASTANAVNGFSGLTSLRAAAPCSDGVTVEARAVGAFEAGPEWSIPYFAGPMMGAKSTGQPAEPDRYTDSTAYQSFWLVSVTELRMLVTSRRSLVVPMSTRSRNPALANSCTP